MIRQLQQNPRRSQRRVSLRLVVLCALACLNACAWHQPSPAEGGAPPTPPSPDLIGSAFQADAASQVVKQNSADAEADNSELEPPLKVSVAQAFYVGQKLNLKIHLRSKTEISPSEILVSVLGLKEGQIVERHEKRISEIYNDDKMSPDESVVLRFVLDRTDLSEYQVLCGWGKDAQTTPTADVDPGTNQQAAAAEPAATETLTDKTAPTTDDSARAMAPTASEPAAVSELPIPTQAEGPELSIEDVELEEQPEACKMPPCDIRYTIRARLKNNGTFIIKGLEMAVGLAWAEGSKLPKPPADFAPTVEGEAIIDLSTTTLNPIASKKLRVNVDRPVPVVPGGAFIPYIRLLTVKERS